MPLEERESASEEAISSIIGSMGLQYSWLKTMLTTERNLFAQEIAFGRKECKKRLEEATEALKLPGALDREQLDDYLCTQKTMREAVSLLSDIFTILTAVEPADLEQLSEKMALLHVRTAVKQHRITRWNEMLRKKLAMAMMKQNQRTSLGDFALFDTSVKIDETRQEQIKLLTAERLGFHRDEGVILQSEHREELQTKLHVNLSVLDRFKSSDEFNCCLALCRELEQTSAWRTALVCCLHRGAGIDEHSQQIEAYYEIASANERFYRDILVILVSDILSGQKQRFSHCCFSEQVGLSLVAAKLAFKASPRLQQHLHDDQHDGKNKENFPSEEVLMKLAVVTAARMHVPFSHEESEKLGYQGVLRRLQGPVGEGVDIIRTLQGLTTSQGVLHLATLVKTKENIIEVIHGILDGEDNLSKHVLESFMQTQTNLTLWTTVLRDFLAILITAGEATNHVALKGSHKANFNRAIERAPAGLPPEPDYINVKLDGLFSVHKEFDEDVLTVETLQRICETLIGGSCSVDIIEDVLEQWGGYCVRENFRSVLHGVHVAYRRNNSLYWDVSE